MRRANCDQKWIHEADDKQDDGESRPSCLEKCVFPPQKKSKFFDKNFTHMSVKKKATGNLSKSTSRR